jgi:hypothetical protein
MMKLSDASNRTLLFSLTYGLQTVAGAVGSVFAGQLPAFFGNLLGVDSTSAAAYQAVLIVTILFGTTSLIPLWMMREPQTVRTKRESGVQSTGRFGLSRLTAKLATPNLLIGMGAAINPAMNVFFKTALPFRFAGCCLFIFDVGLALVGRPLHCSAAKFAPWRSRSSAVSSLC